MDARDIFMQFVDGINQHDAETLYSLMSEDHRFIDSMGTIVDDREGMKKGWGEYFRMVPDYRIEIEEEFINNDKIFAIGKAMGTYTADGVLKEENYWQTIAAWKTVVRDDKIALWQVIADNEPIREIIRKESLAE
jgi:ketosteroid isomerase-like protein